MSNRKMACPKCHKVVSVGGPHVRRKHRPVSKKDALAPIKFNGTTVSSNGGIV